MTASVVIDRARAVRDRAERTTLLAFLLAVGLGGLSPVFVRATLRELPPMWGGTVRFSTAAAILILVVLVRGIPRPRGRELLGTLLFGALGLGLSTALIYRGLVDTPAGVSQVILALVPLETLLLAVAVRLERFRLEGLIGALIAVVGVAIVFSDQLSANVPLLGLLCILAAGVAIAGTTVVLKWFPAAHPISSAATALPVGALVFILASITFGESHPLPSSPAVWLALGWLVTVGTIGVMTLFLFVINRLSASAASYQFLLLPLVTVAASAVATGEQVSPAFGAGAAVVLLGVYVGIVRTARSMKTPVIPAPIE
jgi:drug/metabolite transporter (DMT)-like permease